MTHCANGHAEILHYEDACPFCAAIEEAARKEALLAERVTMLEGPLDQLRGEHD